MQTLDYILLYIGILVLVVIVLLIILNRNKRLKKLDSAYVKHSFDSEYSDQAKKEHDAEKKKSGIGNFLESFTFLIGRLLGRLWEWWFKPKIVLMTLAIVIIALAIGIYYILNTKSGEIIVAVQSPIDKRINSMMIPQPIENVKLKITALDKMAQGESPLRGIKFKTLVDSIDENESETYITTNKDGIAKVFYKGRNFNYDQLALKIESLLKDSPLESIYDKSIRVDSSFSKRKDVNLITFARKRPLIKTYKPLLVSKKDMELPTGMEPPEFYSVEITQVDADTNQIPTGKFYLQQSKKEEGEIIKLDGTKFLAEELEFEKTYYIACNVEDSSNISFKFILPPEFADFSIEPNKVTDLVTAEDQDESLPAASPSAGAPASQVNYTFKIVDKSGKSLSSISAIFYSPTSKLKEKYISSSDGIFSYPKDMDIIENSAQFWKEHEYFKIKLESYGVKSRNIKTWRKPKDIGKSMKYQIIFDIESEQIIDFKPI